jgi:hypothetical protein
MTTGLDGPEIERPWDRITAITDIRYHSNDLIIEASYVVGFMGEKPVWTCCATRMGAAKTTG